ncbi:MAG: oleate hydratase [Rhodopseudomonas sp.]|uniref:oleate hydratase n=1 Tax=Rhodopseudomonas sp. TaxID=1078 RepID=UPI00181F90D1|nr:oleate hydratase [Rhodopseudomonas sp.]NVN85201.1 oleate hydratase [Rhodopseudomonas sp.]
MAIPTRSASRGDIHAHLVGGGIAALASAAYLIRDGGVPGGNITIYEETAKLGGSLDGSGSAKPGYVIRGGRMFTYEAYTCTFDLLSQIPTLDDPSKTVSDDIHAFNEEHIPHSNARLVRGGEKVDVSVLGFSNQDRLDLIELMAVSEDKLGAKRIEDMFQPSFFKTNFWYMWVTTFAFQPWHSAVELKRYLQRFIQEFPRIHTLAGVRRTRYNQYDSIVLPVTNWLKAQGVKFETGMRVTDLDFKYGPAGKAVERLQVVHNGKSQQIAVGEQDLVFVTNGSMTTASSLGSNSKPAPLHPKDGKTDGSWALWETLAAKHPEFGRPAAFNSRIDESKWLSFTTTMTDPIFFELMEKFTCNVAGTGGLVTFTDSNWLMSVVLAAQPHFIGQPDNIKVFWGYGLFVDQIGNFVKKKMSDCSGEELMTELIGHLRFDAHKASILKASNCIPCMMPFITSQFMPRVAGDRPPVTPPGTHNLAFIGQYCEIPDDVVFTVEYSVRSAQTAVFTLLVLEKQVSPLYKGTHDPRVMFAAMKTLMR